MKPAKTKKAVKKVLKKGTKKVRQYGAVVDFSIGARGRLKGDL